MKIVSFRFYLKDLPLVMAVDETGSEHPVHCVETFDVSCSHSGISEAALKVAPQCVEVVSG